MNKTSANSLEFILKDYHAILEADIRLNGLTVLAGLNGSGKSTIARWLYGFIYYSNNFDEIIRKRCNREILMRLNRLNEVERRLAFWANKDTLPRHNDTFRDSEQLETLFLNRVYAIRDIMTELYHRDVLDPQRVSWLVRSLGVRKGINSSFEEITDCFMAKEEDHLRSILERTDRKLSENSVADLFRMIEEGLDIRNRGEVDLQVVEEGTPLIDYDFIHPDRHKDQSYMGRFLKPYGMKRAIYIDSPMAVTNSAHFSNPLWNMLCRMLSTPLREMPDEGHEILLRIQRALGGEVQLRDKDFGSKELRYVRRSDNLDIPIDEVATGMKSFAYLYRLLQNGYIDSETLLIIDEPEAHLHPQWVVTFAEILVLIDKLLGTRIMVASHDPDMIAALQTLSKRYEIEDATNFYIAKPCDNRFKFVNLGTSISEIFESFNIALERIDSFLPDNDE